MNSRAKGIVQLYTGKTKSGKSYHAEQNAKKRDKVVAYDFAHVFSGGKIISQTITLDLMKSLISKYGFKKNRDKKFKLIFRKPFNETHHTFVAKLALFVQMLGRSYGQRSFENGEEIAFIVDEADKCTSRKSDDRVRILAGAGRHDNISTWLIVQRPMNLHPDFRDNASEIFAFKVGRTNNFYKEIFPKNKLARLNNSPKHCHLYWNDSMSEDEIKLIGPSGKEI